MSSSVVVDKRIEDDPIGLAKNKSIKDDRIGLASLDFASAV